VVARNCAFTNELFPILDETRHGVVPELGQKEVVDTQELVQQEGTPVLKLNVLIFSQRVTDEDEVEVLEEEIEL
jgi:hypothetical protein